MTISSIELNDIREAFTVLSDIICENWEGAEEPTPSMISKAVLQLFEVLSRSESTSLQPDDQQIKPEEIQELGEYGLALFEEMSSYAADMGLNDVAEQMEDLTFPFAVWLARKNSEIKNIAPVVNALTRKANQIEDTNLLKQLYHYINEIIDNLSPSITQDLEKTETRHPWRILIINRAIIATRSHDQELMTRAFDFLIEQLPEEAALFFEEGVEQMYLIDYPEHVKDLMQRYYLLHGTSRTLH